MPEQRSTRLRDAEGTRTSRGPEYYYRRPLGLRELFPAIGVGIGAGFFAFYVTRLLLQRTPLDVEHRPRARRIATERSADA